MNWPISPELADQHSTLAQPVDDMRSWRYAEHTVLARPVSLGPFGLLKFSPGLDYHLTELLEHPW